MAICRKSNRSSVLPLLLSIYRNFDDRVPLFGAPPLRLNRAAADRLDASMPARTASIVEFPSSSTIHNIVQAKYDRFYVPELATGFFNVISSPRFSANLIVDQMPRMESSPREPID